MIWLAVALLVCAVRGAVELRGAWLATVLNIDWPSEPGLPMRVQQQQLADAIDEMAQLNLNMVVFQVRPTADALYESAIEPWSRFITGTQGESPGWDPLAFAVERAHSHGMELHAWINPFRAGKGDLDRSKLAPNHMANDPVFKDVVYEYGDQLWADPGVTVVRERVHAVVDDIAQRYAVDAIHMDDYFYPYPTAQEFPDDATYAEYVRQHPRGALSRADWRRHNVDTLVRDLFRQCRRLSHQLGRRVRFGVSPFGIYRPNHPRGIKGMDAYEMLFADSAKWLYEGWVDYFVPQLYWRIDPPEQSYPVLLKWWTSHHRNPRGRLVVAGNYASRTCPEVDDWDAEEIRRQIEISRQVGELTGQAGNVHFSWQAIRRNCRGIRDMLDVAYADKADIPAY